MLWRVMAVQVSAIRRFRNIVLVFRFRRFLRLQLVDLVQVDCSVRCFLDGILGELFEIRTQDLSIVP